MVKKLSPIGNSYGLIIDRPILDLLGIQKDTLLEVTTDGKSITLRPIVTDHAAKVRESAARMGKIHRKTLKRLAD